MAENTTPHGENDENTEAPGVADPAQEEATDWKAEARKHESRSKEWQRKARDNEAAAKRLAEIEESAKSDLEKALARAEAAEKKVAEFEQRDQIRAWADEITKDSPIPPAALRGSTREELEDHFQTLVALIPAPAGEPDPQQKPVSTIGQQPASQRSVPIADQIAAAQQAGDSALVQQLKAIQLGSVTN